MNEIQTVFTLDGDTPQEDAIREAMAKVRKKFYPDFDGKLIYTTEISGGRTFFFTHSSVVPDLYATGFIDFTKSSPWVRALRFRFKPSSASIGGVKITPDETDDSVWKVSADFQIDMDWAGSEYASARWEFRYDKSNHEILITDHEAKGHLLFLSHQSDENDVQEAYDDGWAAYVCEDYEKAITFFERAANGGDAHAAYLLGGIYERDRFLDFERAAVWFGKSAELGHVQAAYKLGVCLDSARGVKLNMKAAAIFLKLAAEAGYGYAQYRLGGMYEHGRGLEKDMDKARFWYEKAATPGSDAERRLKRMGGDKQAIEMWRWDWSLDGQSTSTHHDDIVYLRSDAMGAAKKTEKDGDWARTLNAYKEAYQEYDSVAALYEIGRIYFEGVVDGAPDLTKAKDWWELGKKRGLWQSKKALEAIGLREIEGSHQDGNSSK